MKYFIQRFKNHGGCSLKRTSTLLKKQGFTLIELLVVIAVIGILAAVVLASLNSARAKARNAKRITELKQVQTALEMYYSDNGSYPVAATINGTSGNCSAVNTQWDTYLQPLVTGGYLPSLPVDPLNVKVGDEIYCYAYVTSNLSSSAKCNNINRTDYAYAISFSVEDNASFNLPVYTGSVPLHDYCMVGEKL